jgi:hypothetical protein
MTPLTSRSCNVLAHNAHSSVHAFLAFYRCLVGYSKASFSFHSRKPMTFLQLLQQLEEGHQAAGPVVKRLGPVIKQLGSVFEQLGPRSPFSPTSWTCPGRAGSPTLTSPSATPTGTGSHFSPSRSCSCWVGGLYQDLSIAESYLRAAGATCT